MLESLLDQKRFKPVWKQEQRNHFCFYCPLCAIQRRVPYSPSPWQWKHVFRIALSTAVFTLCTWPWFSWKGIVAFVPFWAVFEFFYRTRVRALLRCRQCGFDPFLYLVDLDRATEEVKNHWRKVCEEKGLPYPLTPEALRELRGCRVNAPEPDSEAASEALLDVSSEGR